MNRTYKSIYNERTGTFVAVAENVNARGKRTSSRVSRMGGIAAALAAGSLVAAGALADVVIPNEGADNQINFTTSGGSINFSSNDGSITGLADLVVGGSLTADQITSTGALTAESVTSDGDLTVDGTTTLKALTAGATNVDALSVAGGSTEITGTGVKTNRLTAGSTTINTSGVTTNQIIVTGGPVVSGDGIAMNNKTITGLADGTAADHAVNKGQLDVVANEAGKGWQLAAGGVTGTEQVKPGDTVTFEAGKNMVVERDGAKITYKTADEVGFNKVSITGGPVLSNDGIAMGGKKITGLADADISAASTDAVTGRQVHDLFFETGAGGVRYFHSKSTAADSKANGEESIAIGPNTVAGGDSSFAAGDGAETTEDAKDAIALGTGAKAGTTGQGDGEAAVAIGKGAQAAGDSTIALGDGAKIVDFQITGATAIGQGAIVSGIDSKDAIAMGTGAHASAVDAVAVGKGAQASGEQSSAFGAGANAEGLNSIALGHAVAASSNAFAAGNGAQALSDNGIALGAGAGQGTIGDPGGDRHSHIAIGVNAGQNVNGNQTIAIGSGAGTNVGGGNVNSTGSIAIGADAGSNIAGEYNISLGHEANKSQGAVTHTTAVGSYAKSGDDAVAVGFESVAGKKGVAVGSGAEAETNALALGQGAEAEQGHIAIGQNSKAVATDADGTSYLTGDAFNGTVVSMGETGNVQRRVVNVADGANRYDAVNVGQLHAAQQKVQNLIGGEITLEDNGSFDGYVIELEDKDGVKHQYKTVAGAINAVSSGEISVLPGNAAIFNPDGTLTVADATLDDEAVSLQQMNEAIAEKSMKYFSVDPNSDPSNKDNKGASGDNTMAIGPAATASGRSSLAFGHTAQVQNSDYALAIGHDARAQADKATVVGERSRVHGEAGVAIGSNAVSHGKNSIAMGSGSLTEAQDTSPTVDDAIAIGTDARSTADSATAIGQHSRAAGVQSVAQGFTAHALAESSMAFGTNSTANAENAQASGTLAHASGKDSLAYGTQAEASGESSQASGTKAAAFGLNSIATGTGSTALAKNGIAMGTGSQAGFVVNNPHDTAEVARNQNSIAIGNDAKATNLDALAVGRSAEANATKAAAFGDDAEAKAVEALAAGAGARATGEQAAAFGSGAQATAQQALASGAGAKAQADNASAFGAGAKASEAGAVALGQGANAKHAHSVALGDGAETAAAEATASIVIDKNTYDFAGTAPIGTVSVGKPGQERTITNVAAGRISETSTDAINGSQLFRTNESVEALADDLDTAGGSIAAALGGSSSYDPDNHTVTAAFSVNKNDYTNVQEALTYVGQGWQLTTNDSASKMTSILPGDTVNIEQGKNIVVGQDGAKVTIATADEVAFDKVTVGGTTIHKDDGIVSNKVVVKHAGTDIDVGDTLSKGITFAGDKGTATERKLGDTLAIEGDDNITTEASDGKIQVALNKDLDLGDDGSVRIKDITVNNTGFHVTDGPSITLGGIDMNTKQIVNLKAGTEDHHAVNLGQLREVSDVANAGWTIATSEATGSTPSKVAPSKEVDFVGDKNINVAHTQDADGNVQVDVILEDDLDLGDDGSVTIGDTDENTVLDKGGLTVAGTDGSTGVGAGWIEVGGGVNTIRIDGTQGTITGLTNLDLDDPGFAKAGRAATEEQLQALHNLPLSFAGDTGTDVERKLGDTLNIVGGETDPGKLTDGNIGVVANGSDTLEIKLAENIDLGDAGSLTIGGSVLDNDGLAVADGAGNSTTTTATGTTVSDGSGNSTTLAATGTTVTDGTRTTTVGAGAIGVTNGTNTITMDADTGTVAGLSNQTVDYPGFADGSGRAATEEQLKLVNDTANAGWNLATSDDSTTSPSNVAPGKEVDFKGDNNIAVSHQQDADGNVEVTVALNENVDLGATGSLKAGQTTVDNDGVKVGDNVHLNEDGLAIEDGANKTTTTATGMDVTDGDNTTTVRADGVNVQDDDGNETILAATGTTVTDKDGNTTETTASGMEVAAGDGSASTTVGAGTIEVKGTDPSGGTNTIAIDGNTGTIEGLTNTTWDPDTIPVVVDRAATEGQLKQVHDVANAGWYVGVDGEGTGEKVAPGAKVDFSNTDGNIEIARNGTDLTFDLAKDVRLDDDGSLSVGKTTVDNSGVAVGDDVHLGDDGLVIDGGPSVTKGGIDAGGQKITNVADGEISATSKDAVNGSQLHALAEKPLTFGGDFGTDVDRKLGEKLSIVGGATNAADLTEGNIGVVANGQNELEIKLNKDVDLGADGSVTLGQTKVTDKGVQVGNNVHLGDQGLVINGGPSVTLGGINAGGKQITNVAAGTQNDHAVNLGQLKGGLNNLDNSLTRKGMNFADQAGNVTHRDLGQTMQIVGANSNVSTEIAGDGLLAIALNDDLILDSVTIANGGPIINKGGINMSGKRITNLADGVDAGDAVNLGQLEGGLNDLDQELTQKGLNFADASGNAVHRDLGQTLTVVGSNENITTKTTQPGILEIVLNNDLDLDTVTVDSVTIKNGGPIINETGIDMSDKRVINVADGVNAGDATNVGQLHAVRDDLQNQLNVVHENLQGQVNSLRGDLRRTDKKLSAGVAAAMATAALPQAYLPGKHMMSMAGGTWNGESGMAVGFSGITDNGRWVYKLSGNASSRGTYGGAVGVGYQW